MTTPSQRELAQIIADKLNGTAFKGYTGGSRHVLKSSASYVGEGRFVIKATTERLDEMGDIVVANGVDWSDFARNPILLFNHDTSHPIGRGSNWRRNPAEPGWLLDGYIPPGGSIKGDEVIRLNAANVMKSWSIGFVPVEQEPIDPKRPWAGTRYLRSKIIEVSAVAIPANSDCVTVEQKSMGGRNSSKAQRTAEARALARPEYKALLALEETKALAATASMSRAERIALAESMRNPPGAVVRELAPANTAQGYAQRMNLHQNAVQGAASKSGHYTKEERLAIARQVIADSNRI